STTSLPRVYLAGKPNYAGLLEGIKAYQFAEKITIPDSAAGLQIEEADETEAVLSPDLVAHMNDGE
ncbi:MAG: hypothetical protein P1V20_29450, partial [Verrucomicrobiales bacterium]|nr:hypothetical protein [Verrucomicrobiales bacterium]